MRPKDPDDIDARFEALIAQFDKDEIRRLVEEAEGVAEDPPQEPGERPPATPPRRFDRRGMLPVVVIVLSGLVVLIGLVVSLRPDMFGDPGPGDTPSPRYGEAPTVARADPILTPIEDDEAGQELPRLADPFAGSPAAAFADGTAGLVTPPARALGGLTEEEVGAALARVRRLLAVAYLDPATVRGKKPDAFVKLLDPGQRGWFARHLDKAGTPDTRTWVFSLDPRTAEPNGDTVKVDGKTTITAVRGRAGAATKGRGGVTIKADYLFVYAVRPPGDQVTTMRVVAHYVVGFSARRDGGRLVVWVDGVTRSVFGARCDARGGAGDGFVRPGLPGSPEEARPSGAPTDPYDRRESGAGRHGCRPTTGT
ncbi:hypothetical protein GCM10023194_18540 [Planotetraspora phitsanulokensis]|uniref:Uncharacterized protein n=1 Tax=Planotetraspora phitsanulokensis TaxID=575192 RepID=A0A8J3TYS9_9ACTN|nr:hypothetical protein [Planotetraspora phitsanulokensis]GII35215.1 hypothetical protein Pph01_02180 [Planotetraspora phitsanulokensis]